MLEATCVSSRAEAVISKVEAVSAPHHDDDMISRMLPATRLASSDARTGERATPAAAHVVNSRRLLTLLSHSGKLSTLRRRGCAERARLAARLRALTDGISRSASAALLLRSLRLLTLLTAEAARHAVSQAMIERTGVSCATDVAALHTLAQPISALHDTRHLVQQRSQL